MTGARAPLADAPAIHKVPFRAIFFHFTDIRRARGRGYELVWWAAELKLDAERKAGGMLADMDKAKRGPDAVGQGSQRATSGAATLSDFKITKSQSSRWQLANSLPEEVGEAPEGY